MQDTHPAPAVDVITAVHTPSRPVERAVGSVLKHTVADVRVTVVVHNTDPAPISARLQEYLDDPRLRVITHTDDYRTPAGPKNLGLSLATAQYTAMLDSDDSLEPGALDAWLAAAETPAGAADAVIAPTSGAHGRLHPSPPIRWTRARTGSPLDPYLDRLAYRASPLGLIGRARFGHLRFAEGIPTGEDQPVTAELWFTPGSRVVFPTRAPRYLEHDDQVDRVTAVSRSVAEEFASLDVTLAPGTPWARSKNARLSLGVKLMRVHLFDALRARINGAWDREAASQLAEAAERIAAWAPLAPGLLSRADARLLAAIRAEETDSAILRELLAARGHLRSPGALLPQRMRYVFHSQAPLRYHLAGALLLRGSRG